MLTPSSFIVVASGLAAALCPRFALDPRDSI